LFYYTPTINISTLRCITLFLLQANHFAFPSNKKELQHKPPQLTTPHLPTLIQLQPTQHLTHPYFILQPNNHTQPKQFLQHPSININLLKQLPLLGKELHQLKKPHPKIHYLLTSNIPQAITIHQYLPPNNKNSLHYQQLPQLQFQPTYLSQHITKSICMYHPPDEH
ncbi:DUF4242 domain-containing protein, partial [Staphylococcus saprophyticus]|uniref:DUF4242 domain-containing protein n=1 Tax=Staphylococcus saprophyticus TaxID=29385 RepID=UPI001C92F210